MIDVIVAPLYISDSETVIHFLQMKYDDLGRSIEFWEKRTQFWWHQNPYYINNMPIGWGLWAGGILVGYLGCIFTNLEYNRIQYTSLNLTCWHVEPEFRGRSLDLFLLANTFMQDAVYFNTSPTPQVEKILNASKYYKYISGSDDLMCKLIPLNLNQIKIDSKFDLPIKVFRPILKLASTGVNVFIKKVWDCKKLFISEFKSLETDELNIFKEKCFGDVLTINRSLKFYQWLLNANHKKYQVLVVRKHQNAQVIAIGLFQSYEYKENQILEMVDFCSAPDEDLTDKRIIRKMIASIHEQKDLFPQYVAISLTDYSGICINSCPGKLKFRSRNNKYCKTFQVKLKELLETKQYLFSAQGDMYL